MATSTLKGILTWPLIITAVFVVLRVVSERAGWPDWVSSALSVVFLSVLAAPLYFAVRIAGSRERRPYMTLFKLIALYAVLARLMILPTYWLACIYEWTQNRFYGLWGPDVTPFMGFIVVPFVTAAFWIVASLVVGGTLGSIIIAIRRRRPTDRSPAQA